MSVIKSSFYHIFWSQKSCQNIFLLSKDELLDSVNVGSEDNSYSYSHNRIIISNIDSQSDEIDTIRLRNENYSIRLDDSIEEKIEYLRPIIENFFDRKFKKSIDNLSNDFSNKGWKLVLRIVRILSNEKTREKNLIKLLHDYGFVGKHLSTFKQIEESFEKQLIPSKGNELVNESNIKIIREIIKFVKELYVNYSYEKLYNTNQVLINSLYSQDSFESRIKVFHHLYDSRVIRPSSEDSFIECSNCEPGTYRGVFQIKLDPRKLKDLICPVCSNELVYFIPYELDSDIYEIIKSPDGLLLDALCALLEKNEIEFEINQIYLNDIEIDCVFHGFRGQEKVIFLVESKMYKLNTTENKIISKIKEHYGKFINDINRLAEIDEFKSVLIEPILLLNVPKNDLLINVENELKLRNSGIFHEKSKILNLDMLVNYFEWTVN